MNWIKFKWRRLTLWAAVTWGEHRMSADAEIRCATFHGEDCNCGFWLTLKEWHESRRIESRPEPVPQPCLTIVTEKP